MRPLITSFVLTVLTVSSALAAETADTEAIAATALEAALEEAELAFAKSATDRDRAAFESFLTPQTVFATPHGNLRGPEAILAQWGAFFAPGGPSIGWRPELVAVVDDGTVGMTSGPFWIEASDPEGKPLKYTGTFFSVWRRDENGAWRIVLDTGTDAQPVEAP